MITQAENKKKALVLGGTGAMGVYLIPELAKMGYEVYVTSRKEHDSDDKNVIYVKGNAKNDEFIDPLLEKGFDVIVDFMIYHTPDFEKRYTKMLSNTKHYLFLSSYRVYGDNGSKPITEESPRLLDCIKDEEYLKTDEYALTKARQENMLKNSGYSNWTIIRPAITYSSTRFQLGTLEANEFVNRALENKAIIFPKPMLKKEATMSWAGDVAKMIAKLVLNEKAYGEVFTASTSEHHKWKEVVKYYNNILGLKVKYVSLNVYLDIIGRPWQVKYDRMYNRVVDNTKILEATGMSQSELMPLYEGLRMELDEFVKNPVFAKVDQEQSRKVDEVTESVIKRILWMPNKAWKNRKDLPLKLKNSKIVKIVKRVWQTVSKG